jgi:hypothetical protein
VQLGPRKDAPERSGRVAFETLIALQLGLDALFGPHQPVRTSVRLMILESFGRLGQPVGKRHRSILLGT